MYMLAWSFFFSIIMAMSKFLTDVHLFMLVFFRSLFGLVALAPVITSNGISSMRTQHGPKYLILIVLSCTAMLSTYYGYINLPLATATSIGFTAPFMKVMLAALLLNDHADWRTWTAIFFGYLGVLVIVQPGYVPFEPAILVALLANLLASCFAVVAKKISKDDSELHILFYTSLGRVVVLGTLAAFYWQTPSGINMMMLMALGVLGTLSNFCYLRGLKIGKLSLISPFEYTRLVFAVPISILVFAEYPTVWTLTGSAIIIASNLTMAIRDARKKVTN